MTEGPVRYCVIGYPVGHSLSPRIHAVIREELGLRFEYEKRSVPPAQLAAFIETCRAEGLAGCNVTHPHKQTVMALLDACGPSACRTGAVNTIVSRQGMLTGHNTDIAGVHTALDRARCTDISRAVIFGAGGAARAAAAALIDKRCGEITVLSRTEQSGRRFAADFTRAGVSAGSDNFSLRSLTMHLAQADLIINAAPVGMTPGPDASLLPDPELLPRRAAVMDMVYSPMRTRLLRQAQERGCRIIPGIDMLIGQALASQEIWQGRSLPQNLFSIIKKHLRSGSETKNEADRHDPAAATFT